LTWIGLLESLDKDLMDLLSELFFNFDADWLSDLFTKSFVDVFFVVVDSYLGGLEMSDVPKHFEGIVKGIQEVVKLVN